VPLDADRRSTRWLHEELAALKQLANEGLPAAAIALSLDRSAGAVQQKAKELWVRLERARDSRWWRKRAD
jgi:hypothetical protein